MAVALIATDTWLSHLEFTGGRRQTEFGPIDGLFYGVLSTTGDASAGNLTLNGLVSFDRKEDWVYILQKVSLSTNVSTAARTAFIVAATGPVIPTASAVVNPSFHVAGPLVPIINNVVSTFQTNEGSETPFKDLPLFGDKKLAGSIALIAAGFQDNDNGTVYQMSIYGWLIRYSSFFRNLGGSFG